MLSELALAALTAVLVSTQAGTTSDVVTRPDAVADVAPSQAPTSGPMCSADDRRARRMAAAEERRLHRDALKVTIETLAQAAQIIATRSDSVVERWQAEFRSGARSRLDSTRDRDRSMRALPTPALCRALATRDVDACQSLDDVSERTPCAVWAEVMETLRTEAPRCEKLSEPGRTICALALTRDPQTCERAPSAHRAFCASAASSMVSGAQGCSAPFQPQRCTWALLVGAMTKGAPSCESEAPAGDGLTRAMAFCRAATRGEAERCPNDERPAWATVQGTRSLQWEEALRVERHEDTETAWVALMTSGPAACVVTVDGEGAETDVHGAAILSTLVDELVRLGPLRPSDRPRALRTHCVPTVDWRGLAQR